jgi:pterin-4a-carbinolamine dehydratase
VQPRCRSAVPPLKNWRKCRDTLSSEYPEPRYELQRTFEFDKFIHALDFMHEIAPLFDRSDPPHHPRWDNAWKNVTIRLTTWDVGNKITQLDIKAARMIDDAYERFLRRG